MDTTSATGTARANEQGQKKLGKGGRLGMGVNRTLPPGKLRTLVNAFRENLHLPDPAPLYVVVGTIAGNLLPGVPVWTMLIGPPACGGTELLLATQHVRQVHLEGRLSGEAALLSGTPRKDLRAGATGGILREMGSSGIFLLKDFTSVLTMAQDEMRKLLGAFVELYDGKWSRNIGADGGRKLEWSGKLGFLTKCTPAIDRHHGVMADLGPRFVFFRYPTSGEGYAESLTAMTRVGFEQVREDLDEHMKEFFEDLVTEELPEVDHETTGRMIALATISSRARSVVYRHPWTREVEDVPSWEMPPRLTQELAQLCAGMLVAGVPEEERWRVIGKVAVDGIPSVRRVALMALARDQRRHDLGYTKAEPGLGVAELVLETKCSVQTTRRALEDLQLHGVVVEGKKGKVDFWSLSEWAQGTWKMAYPKGYEGMLGDRWAIR
jgi:hypothetical protein